MCGSDRVRSVFFGGGTPSLLPPADHLFVPSEHLMVIGRHEDIQRVLKRI